MLESPQGWPYDLGRPYKKPASLGSSCLSNVGCRWALICGTLCEVPKDRGARDFDHGRSAAPSLLDIVLMGNTYLRLWSMEDPEYGLPFLFAREVLCVPVGFADILELRCLHSRGNREVTEARTP
jgi:hypothetical protein